MDAVTLVVAALAAGAAAGATNVASTAVMDAYRALKSLVIGRLRGGELDDKRARNLLDDLADQVGQEKLAEELSRVGVDDPIVEAARKLMELLEHQKGKFVVDASQAKGLIVGDHGVQHNTFN